MKLCRQMRVHKKGLSALRKTLLITMAVVFLAIGQGCTEQSTGSSTPPPTQVVGVIARVFKEGATSLPFFADRSAIDELYRARAKRDDYGSKQLVASGRIFTVPNDTMVVTLSKDELITEVQIVRGPLSGKTGWVPYEWVLPPH